MVHNTYCDVTQVEHKRKFRAEQTLQRFRKTKKLFNPKSAINRHKVGSINSFSMLRLLETQFGFILTITALRNIRCCSHSVATPYIACTVQVMVTPLEVSYRRQPLKIARQGFSFNRNALINNIYFP